jgi:hypothetical protein
MAELPHHVSIRGWTYEMFDQESQTHSAQAKQVTLKLNAGPTSS